MLWSHFLPLPALQQPCVPSPLHTEHDDFRHTCLYNTFSKISLSTHFISIFLFSLSQVHSVDFVTRLQQLSAPHYFGNEFEVYHRVFWSVLEYDTSFAVDRKVSVVEKCEMGFFKHQGSAGIIILYSSLD